MTLRKRCAIFQKSKKRKDIPLKTIKKISFFALVTLLLLTMLCPATLNVSASSADSPPSCNGVEAYCFYDLTHSRMLASRGADTVIKTSTSAKVTSGLIFCEQLADRLDEQITVTAEMIYGVSGHNMHLAQGETISIKDLLYAAICGSYNDAAYALADAVSGSVDAFLELMNRRASELGASSTFYTNPIGFPENDEMVTTAADTLNIARAAALNPLYRELCGTIKHTIPATNKSEARTLYNKNSLIATTSYGTNYYLSSASGMNAGYSGEGGGWSVVSVCEDEGVELLCVVLGGKESEDGTAIYAYEAVHSLFRWASSAYERLAIFTEGQSIATIDISLTGIAAEKATCITATALDVYIPVGERDLYYEPIFNENSLRAPVKAGDEVGRVIVVCNGETVGECRMILGEDHDANAIMLGIEALGDYTKSRAFIATLACFAILMAAVLIIRTVKPNAFKKKRRKY